MINFGRLLMPRRPLIIFGHGDEPLDEEQQAKVDEAEAIGRKVQVIRFDVVETREQSQQFLTTNE
jgi:hypothetical protein